MAINNHSSKFDAEYFVRMTEEVGKSWSKSLQEMSHKDFMKHYSPDVDWLDHAFQIHRKGHVGLEMLRERWLTCNQPYKVTITDIHPTKTGSILEGFAEGVFAEDLYTIKATGKAFTYTLCIRLDFNTESGLIDRVNEYYTKTWDTSVPVSRYRVDYKREGARGLPRK
ncbi:hypothetical protein M409DRAFT_54175 [Zasmidium cellare ATCC 36951]|uniref:SnoaL-like domain-containing protein n=1 Tax=Zasmidium cellare ATCC 36951 TaxID=1080233 RepID=A0A6A6CLR9_ZASCE|nr:uncharacterized protein M409DRAFT_54175 [Zasmidium cellare ATCC 36951]KAF2167583.1 hypothetical protein M409DRAFT_54175 [Zasmidium cellare ATCC 36951]